jgi:hypothetical protein
MKRLFVFFSVLIIFTAFSSAVLAEEVFSYQDELNYTTVVEQELLFVQEENEISNYSSSVYFEKNYLSIQNAINVEMVWDQEVSKTDLYASLSSREVIDKTKSNYNSYFQTLKNTVATVEEVTKIPNLSILNSENTYTPKIAIDVYNVWQAPKFVSEVTAVTDNYFCDATDGINDYAQNMVKLNWQAPKIPNNTDCCVFVVI